MYKYKCKSVGDCSIANRGEPVTSESMLNDLKCSDCGCALELMEESNGGVGSAKGDSRKAVVIGGVVAALVVLAGAGWFGLGLVNKPVVTAQIQPASANLQTSRTHESVVQPAPVVTGGLSPSEAQTANARRDADKKLENGEFSEAEKKSARAAALEMIKTAVAKMGQGDLVGAEKELNLAHERDAAESLIYYNLAIVRLRQQQPDEALKQLEAAFMAGFSHFDAMDKDRDLDSLRSEPKFKKLMGIYRKNA